MLSMYLSIGLKISNHIAEPTNVKMTILMAKRTIMASSTSRIRSG